MVRFLPLPYDRKDPARGSFYITQSRQKTDPLLNVSQAPLNTRGWVLQERLLSRRILHFAADQVYWECRSHALAQDGTVFRPKGPVDFLFPLPSLIRSIYNSFSNHCGSDEIFMRSWLHIIEFYSACNFTYEKDRLPALLGLADRLSRFTNREYINGHWFDLSSNVIPNTLLWTACGQITKISKSRWRHLGLGRQRRESPLSRVLTSGSYHEYFAWSDQINRYSRFRNPSYLV